MKLKNFLYVVAIIALLGYTSCKKSPTEDPHNHSLLNKTVRQIRDEVAGKWQLQYAINETIAGPQKFTPATGQGELFRFLANDTVKISSYNDAIVYLYAKAQIEKIAYPIMNVDYVYHYTFASQDDLLMLEIKNDTLVIQSGLNRVDSGGDYYLTRKQ